MGLVKLCLLFLVLFLVSATNSIATGPMESGIYKIDQTQFDDSAAQDKPDSQPLVKSSGSYTFAISESVMDFGQITPTNPLTRKNIVNINSNERYFLKTYENHQLASSQGETIPDTTCDGGNCTEQTPDIWKSVISYGFGFNCQSDKNNCDEDFLSDNSFSQFANKSRNEPYNSLLSGASGANQLELTYKLNISSQQKPATYSNTVTLLLLPSY